MPETHCRHGELLQDLPPIGTRLQNTDFDNTLVVVSVAKTGDVTEDGEDVYDLGWVRYGEGTCKSYGRKFICVNEQDLK